MSNEAANVVVILAAGFGSRLKSDEGVPKPLLPVRGRALILRVLDRFSEAGVAEAVVVLGHRADEVRRGIMDDSPEMPVSFVFNSRFQMSNGLSVLAARETLGERPFFLSMADHVFESSLIRGLSRARFPEDGIVLAVDRKLDAIYDMEDATKVRTESGRIVAIHKELDVFDAVDTGLFLCRPALLDAIEAQSRRNKDGDCTLSDGVKTLAGRGVAFVHDVGAGLWQDVDTPETAQHAETIFD